VKILIVYRDEPLYRALDLQLRQRGYAVRGIALVELADFLREPADAEGEEGSIVIDCASREPGGPVALDDASFEALAAHCTQRGWPLLLLSDSRVFPVGGKQRYREIDPVQPGSVAGELLAARERLLAASLPWHLILRSGPSISATGDNLMADTLARLRGGGAVAVSNGARFCPTPVADLARVVAAICDQLTCNAQCWGVYHYHSSDPTTTYEFAEVLLAAAAQYWPLDTGRVELQIAVDDPVASLYPLLNCQRVRDTFGIQQLPWRKAIPQLLKTLHADEPRGAGETS